jgi:UrcA family protein
MKTLIASARLPRVITTAILGVLALSCGTVCLASDEVDVQQRLVKFGDLDLSHREGAAALYSRIVNAARVVCGWSIDDAVREIRMNVQHCVDKAIADAVTRVGHPQLIAIYNANNRQPLPIVLAKDQTQ